MFCVICKEAFSVNESAGRIPYIFSCGHSFCQSHIENFNYLSCTECNLLEETDNELLPQPPTNDELIGLIHKSSTYSEITLKCEECGTSVNVSKYCSDCKFDFCDACDTAIHKSRIFSGHNRLPISLKPISESKCPIHDEKLKLYCYNEDCCKTVCVLCFTHGEHKDHDCKLLEDVVIPDMKSILTESVKDTPKYIETLQFINKNLFTIETEIIAKKQAIVHEFQEEFRLAREALLAKENEIIRELDDNLKTRTDEIKSTISKSSEHIANLFTNQLEVKTELESTNGLRLVKKIKEVKRDIQRRQQLAEEFIHMTQTNIPSNEFMIDFSKNISKTKVMLQHTINVFHLKLK